MKKYKVAIDLDGVLFDLLPAWLKEYNRMFKDNVQPSDIKEYDLSKFTKKCDRESLMYILEFSDFWENVNLCVGAYEAIERLLAEEKLDVILLTATSYKVATNKMCRLFKLLPMLSENRLIITSRKDLIATDFIIDDYEENLRNAATTEGCTPILITHPYNESYPNNIYNIKRCKNIVEATDFIINQINKGELS